MTPLQSGLIPQTDFWLVFFSLHNITHQICYQKQSFVPPISMPIQYADFGLNPNIVDGRPTPDGDIQSPYSTRSFFLINSSTIALTVVLLKFNAFDICATANRLFLLDHIQNQCPINFSLLILNALNFHSSPYYTPYSLN